MKRIILFAFWLSLLTIGFGLQNCKKTEPAPTPANPGPAPVTLTGLSPSTGEVGTKVVLTGTGFSATPSANKVRFGLTETPVDSASATRLVVKVPKDATTGRITVEVGTKSVSSSTDFTVTQTPPVFVGTGTTANTPASVSATSASIATVLDKEGSRSVVQHGHVWSATNAQPTVNGRLAADGGKTELGPIPANATYPYKFTSDLKDLDPNTTYTLRAYVTTAQGTTYGPVSQMQTKKPCTLVGVDQFTTVTYDAQYRIKEYRIALPNTKPSVYAFSYNAEGYLEKYEQTRIDGTTSSEQYKYDNGRLSRIEFSSGGATTFTYDAQGKLAKKSLNSGDTEYTYADGLLKSVTDKTRTFTVKDGQVVKIDNGNGNYVTYDYDARGNQTGLESFSANKSQFRFDYTYDDKPNYVLTLFSFKGWLPAQILGDGSFRFIWDNSYPNTWLVRKYKSATSDETQTRTYTYVGTRPTSYRQTTVDTINKTNYSGTVTYTYSGDCN